MNTSKSFLLFFGIVTSRVIGIDGSSLESGSEEINGVIDSLSSKIDSMVAEVVAEENSNDKADATGEELTLNREEREAEPGLKKLLKKLVKKSKRNAEPEAQFQTCVGSQCNQNNLGSSFGAFGLGARPLGLGGFPGAGFGGFSGAQQTCVGSQCNQNNLFGKRKREIAEAVDRLATDILNEEAQQVTKREAEGQIATCIGSLCNQNNLGLGTVNPFNFGIGAQQNCVGSQCNQNNIFARRRREIAEAVNQLAEDMLVEEINDAVRKEAEGQRRRREIVASILEGF